MFFSSGQAQMKGGGDFCIERYSYDPKDSASMMGCRRTVKWEGEPFGAVRI